MTHFGRGSGTPLIGITVVDLTRYLPGPYCTRMLADLGATVIKIEPPQGDPMRRTAWPASVDSVGPSLSSGIVEPGTSVGPNFSSVTVEPGTSVGPNPSSGIVEPGTSVGPNPSSGIVEPGTSVGPNFSSGMFEFLNAGKQIITLDLRDATARDRLDALLASAAVCVEGFKPATAREIGVDGATLAARHPHLVHCSISGYGQSGPAANRAGHDLNYQADAGLLGTGGTPQVPALLIADITAALHAAIAVLAALVARRGTTLDISLVDAARAWVPFVPPPVLRGDFACYNVYETADGGYVALAALESKFWDRFCRHVGHPEWVPLQFVPDPARSALEDAVRTLFRTRARDEWLAELGPLDCCVSGIATAERRP